MAHSGTRSTICSDPTSGEQGKYPKGKELPPLKKSKNEHSHWDGVEVVGVWAPDKREDDGSGSEVPIDVMRRRSPKFHTFCAVVRAKASRDRGCGTFCDSSRPTEPQGRILQAHGKRFVCRKSARRSAYLLQRCKASSALSWQHTVKDSLIHGQQCAAMGSICRPAIDCFGESDLQRKNANCPQRKSIKER